MNKYKNMNNDKFSVLYTAYNTLNLALYYFVCSCTLKKYGYWDRELLYGSR